MRPRILILIASVLLAYLNAFRGAFQFDDFNVIVNNPSVHSLQAWFEGAAGGIRPLLKLSYTLNWVAGGGPFGFHLFNTSVHSLNTVLVYLLFVRLIERTPSLSEREASLAPMGAALIFALHPVQTEAVTYICGRSASLMAFFYLAGAYAYLKGADSGRWRHVISPALFAASVMVKETAVTFPFALALLEFCRGGRKGVKEIARRQWAHWAALFLLLAIMLGSRGYNYFISVSVAERPLVENVLSQINGVAYLITRFFFIDRLNIDPDLPVITGWSPAVIATSVLLVIFFVIGILSLKRRPWIGFGILWFFLHLIPTNSILPRLDIANERHLYLAGAGLFLAFMVEAAKITGALGAVKVKVVFFIFLLIIGSFTVRRNHVYRSETALWEDTAGKSPSKARVFNNLGYAYSAEGRIDEARLAYLEALRLRPGFKTAERNLLSLDRSKLKGTPY
ncbi:MAG: hypothetical protein HY954_09755 [Deltaproteobacteria bacterium]|nr:hypothetical protein [Deltaproteobacteria bacterium]